MDAKTIGNTIATLRKKHGMTQGALAEQLDVSDKAISKWENGQGYPDITMFPKLSALFGVTVDYLLMGERRGIAIAGNMLVDIVKSISGYPEIGKLTFISELSRSVGGAVPNTAIDLAKIDRTLPVSAVGKVGMDENGRFVVSELQKNGINVNAVCYDENTETGFTDVMSVPSGERTFFCKKGTNATFAPTDVDIDSLSCDLLHIGYILLLEKFDEPDEEYGTKMARFLSEVQKRGIETSIDVVTDANADFGKMVIPALKYANYVIINEIECCATFGMDAYHENGKLNRENVKLCMQKMVEHGVSGKVIIHCKERGFLLDAKSGDFIEVPSLKIPKEQIKGSVGAGDAFCAASLYGIYNSFTDRQILEFASAAAACNLFAANSVDGMLPKNEILKMATKYDRLKND